jgi:hypothetical protein
MNEILGLQAPFIDAQRMSELGFRLILDMIFAGIVVFGVYVRRYGKNEYVFTYVMFNVITFMLCFMLSQAPIELGFALGLFAVFGILRYRTEPIRIHELTYLFVVIGLGILNAVVAASTPLAEILVVNAVIASLIAVLEFAPGITGNATMRVSYDDLDLVRAGDQAALLANLVDRTGLDIDKFTVDNIDLLRETARITVYYRR